MGVYLTKWEALKKGFEEQTNWSRPKEDVKKILVGTVSKSSGITPALKDIETALGKKERKPLEQAINKFEVLRNSYSTFLYTEQKKFDPMQDELSGTIWKAYQNLIGGLQKIAAEAADAAKALQEAKSPGQAGIKFLALEAEIKNVVADAKKKLAPYAAQEKKYGLLKKADAAVKLAEKYTKAAARTEVKEALATLEAFQKECKHCAEELDKVLKLEKDTGFQTALASYRKQMADSGVWSRLLEQLKNLKEMM